MHLGDTAIAAFFPVRAERAGRTALAKESWSCA